MGQDGETGGLKLQNTETLREFMKAIAGNPETSHECRQSMLKYVEEPAVPYEYLRDAFAQRPLGDRIPIQQVLAGSSFVLESPKPREKSEELKARLRKLQEEVDKKAYSELVNDVTRKSDYEPEVFSSYKEQLGFGLHVAVTMFTGFAFGYSIFRSQFPDNPVLHASGGALGLIVGMLLETLLFIVRDAQRTKHEDLRAKKAGRVQKSTKDTEGSDFISTTDPKVPEFITTTRASGPVNRQVGRKSTTSSS